MKPFYALVGCLMLLSGPALGADYKLRLGHATTPESTQHAAALKFAELVKERSKGAIELNVFPGSSLGTDQQMINLTRGGAVDIVFSGSSNFNGIVAETAALELPYVFRDPGHVYKVLDGKIGQTLLDELGKHNLKGLAYFENGWRALTNNKRPVLKPADASGLKVRSTPNPYHIQAFRLLGMNPSPLAIAELYTALETRAFDAQEHPLPVLWSSKFYEVQKFLTLTNHAYSPIVAAMNKPKFDAMPPALQEIMVASARDAAAFHRDLNMKEERKIIDGLKKAGMQVVEEFDTASFRKVVYDTVRAAYVEKLGATLITAIEAEQ
ncbi:MAG TPA: DctP family TRAP transporter solute-binding subunit [Beijerinckiaceae bacterium]|nr:DctP family TRAP transporter solute-binding subunit [Beijerinckiaceae bacterium]